MQATSSLVHIPVSAAAFIKCLSACCARGISGPERYLPHVLYLVSLFSSNPDAGARFLFSLSCLPHCFFGGRGGGGVAILWNKLNHEAGRVQTDKRKKKCPSCNEMNPMSVKVRDEGGKKKSMSVLGARHLKQFVLFGGTDDAYQVQERASRRWSPWNDFQTGPVIRPLTEPKGARTD